VKSVVTTLEMEVVLRKGKADFEYVLLFNSKAGYILFGISSLIRKDLSQHLCFSEQLFEDKLQ